MRDKSKDDTEETEDRAVSKSGGVVEGQEVINGVRV